jgi:non-lysosomal glucosylceramidase
LPGTSGPRSLIATGHLTDMKLRSGAEVLAKAPDGRPLVIAHRFEKGRVILLLGDLARGRERTSPQDRNQLLAFAASQTGSKLTVPGDMPKTIDSYGTMCLATLHKDVTHRLAWTSRSRFWADFVARGLMAKQGESPKPSGPGRTWNGALGAALELAPGQEAVVPFVIAWHFPNHFWGDVNVGNRYATWFPDAGAVVKYVTANFDRLLAETRLYRDTLYDSTLPYFFIDAFGSQASIIRSQTCFWCADGTFAAFEGCGPNAGCCPMNCNHVWNYEQALAKLWPGLERDMRITELDFSQWDNGGCAHRVRIPRPKTPDGDFPVADGQCGAVLKAYREYLQSPDETFGKQHWPRIKKAMEYAIKTWDKDEDGVMEQPQFNTYDREIYGLNTFITSLYLGALRAAEEMATVVGDRDAARRFRGIFEKGKTRCARELFNGEYYIQKADNINLGYGTGVWADQVVGQWWAHVLNLGDILPRDQVRSTLKAIFKYNWLWTQVGFQGTQRYLQFADGDDKSLLCGSWPKGGRPADPILYRDEAWTGVEYQVAAHKIWEGQLDEGLAIVKGARERYNGIKRNPWNEIECGDTYARAMSSWSLLLAAQGYSYCGPTRSLGFDPKIHPENHKSLFTTAEAWGTFSQNREEGKQRNELLICYGKLPLEQLSLGLPPTAGSVRRAVRLDEGLLETSGRLVGCTRVIVLPNLTLQKGQTLTVEMNWQQSVG